MSDQHTDRPRRNAAVAYIYSATTRLSETDRNPDGTSREDRQQNTPPEPSGNHADGQLGRIMRAVADWQLELPTSLIFHDEPAPDALRPGWNALLTYCIAHPQPTERRGIVFVTDAQRLGRFQDPRDRVAMEAPLNDAGWDVTPLDRLPDVLDGTRRAL